MRFTVYKGTEKGPYREKNEDSIGVTQKPDTIAGIDGIFAVAAGLGGHERGEVASSMAISMLLESLGIQQQNKTNILKDIPNYLSLKISEISQSICDVGFTGESMHRDPFTAGMATTLTAAVLFNQNIYIGHAGDSRAYLIRAETISYDDYINFNGENGAKDAGKMRVEGSDYLVKDGDIFNFRFNV